MKQKRFWMLAAILAIICGAGMVACCNSKSGGLEQPYVPKEPDYDNSSMWITADGDADGTGADVFYVVSTWEEDWTTDDGRLCHYADVWNATHREHMATEISKVATYMSPGNRFFAPYYRHTTIDAWVTQDEDTISRRVALAMDDVCKAFDHFQARRDHSRPLIIAGFSQGGRAMVELLKHMSDETYSQLAAAYVLGYKVTKADMAQCPHIRPAEGETDTGVTICYNTVKDVKYIKSVIAASDICINPVNWRTDSVPATVLTVGSPWKPAAEQPVDTLTVHIDPATNFLFVSGYTGNDHVLPLMGCEGNYHSREIWFYRESLRQNIDRRQAAFRSR